MTTIDLSGHEFDERRIAECQFEAIPLDSIGPDGILVKDWDFPSSLELPIVVVYNDGGVEFIDWSDAEPDKTRYFTFLRTFDDVIMEQINDTA